MAIIIREDDQPQNPERRLPRGFNKEAYDIVEVIESYGVDLRSAGNELKALCPFHNEKTPSFSVNPDKQAYYCHGCHVGGSVVDFVAAQEGMSRYDSALKLMGSYTARYDEETLRRKLLNSGKESVDSRKYLTAIWRLYDRSPLRKGLQKFREFICRDEPSLWEEMRVAYNWEALWEGLWEEVEERACLFLYEQHQSKIVGLTRSWEDLYLWVRQQDRSFSSRNV